MLKYKIVVKVCGSLLLIASTAMAVSFLVSLFFPEEPDTRALGISTAISYIVSLSLYIPFRRTDVTIGAREGYVIVTGSYLLFFLTGTLPYLLSGTTDTFSDALFESVSGFTATGATILTDIESTAHGILFWRSITQWLGGMGIVVLSIAIIGEIKIGNYKLFAAEVPGVTKDRIHPKISGTSKRLWFIYVLLTTLAGILLYAGGMSLFDAVCHSFTTMASGGFSTRNASIAYYDSAYIYGVITIFMFLTCVNFPLIYYGFKGRFGKIWRNDEFRFFLGLVVIAILLVSSTLWLRHGVAPARAFSEGAFQVTAIITTTGYVVSDYNMWGSFLLMIMFILMFTGGSTGSTGGGIKMLRLLILTKNSRQEFKRIIHPSAVIPLRINRKVVPPPLINQVQAFVVLYFLIAGVSIIIVSAMGYDFKSSLGAVAATLGNIGPGIGDVGPVENYSHFPGYGKWFLSFLMLTGRLELFTVLVLLSSAFYRS